MIITPEIVASYRVSAQGIAFSDITKWPENVVTNALCEADAETGGIGWGAYEDLCSNFKLRGLYYFTSHWLAVTYISGNAEDPTNITPTARLNTSAKSIGDESITYRIGSIQDTEDDWLSLTNYGVQYLRLRRRAQPVAMVV